MPLATDYFSLALMGDIDDYQQSHAAQIAELGRMPADEARWAGVTKSEANDRNTVQAIDQPDV